MAIILPHQPTLVRGLNLPPVASFFWQTTRAENDTLETVLDDIYVDVQVDHTARMELHSFHDLADLMMGGRIKGRGMTWIRGRPEVRGLDDVRLRSVFGVGTGAEILDTIRRANGPLDREFRRITGRKLSAEIRNAIYSQATLRFAGPFLQKLGYFSVASGLHVTPPPEAFKRLKIERITGEAESDEDDKSLTKKLIMPPDAFGYPERGNIPVPMIRREITYQVELFNSRGEWEKIGRIEQSGDGKGDPVEKSALAEGQPFAAFDETTVTDVDGTLLLFENPFIRFGVIDDDHVLMEDMGFSYHNDQPRLAVHGWNRYSPKFVHDILQKDFDLALKAWRLVRNATETALARNSRDEPGDAREQPADGLRVLMPDPSHERRQVQVPVALSFRYVPQFEGMDEDEPELRREFPPPPKTKTVDVGARVAALRKDKIKPFTVDDITAIKNMIVDAQNSPPDNKEGKEQFVEDIRLMLEASKHIVQLEDRTEVRLTVAPGRNGIGCIQFRVVGGRSDSRGFVNTTFDIVPASRKETNRQPKPIVA